MCGGDIRWYQAERIDNPNTHGTGCTLSSAIASNLALGFDMPQSVANAKAYITGCLKGWTQSWKRQRAIESLF